MSTVSRSARRLGLIAMLLFLVALSAGPASAASPGALYYAEAQAAYQVHRYAVAAREYEQAIEHGYRSAGAYYQLGLCYSHLHHWSWALWAYGTALKRDPSFAAIHPNLLRQERIARANGGVNRGAPPQLPSGPIVSPATSTNPPAPAPAASQSTSAPQPVRNGQGSGSLISLIVMLAALALAVLLLWRVRLRRQVAAIPTIPSVADAPIATAHPAVEELIVDRAHPAAQTPDPAVPEPAVMAAPAIEQAPLGHAALSPAPLDGEVLGTEAAGSGEMPRDVSRDEGARAPTDPITLPSAPLTAPVVTTTLEGVAPYAQDADTSTSPALKLPADLAASVALVRSVSYFLIHLPNELLRCLTLLPRRHSASLADELEYARTLLRTRPSAEQFVKQMLLWPGFLLPRAVSVDQFGRELLRTYCVLGLIDRARRPNMKRLYARLSPIERKG